MLGQSPSRFIDTLLIPLQTCTQCSIVVLLALTVHKTKKEKMTSRPLPNINKLLLLVSQILDHLIQKLLCCLTWSEHEHSILENVKSISLQ